MSMALAHQRFAHDIVHLAVVKIVASGSRLTNRSSGSEALEVWFSLFSDPHSHFPSFGVFVFEADLLFARTSDILSLCCFDLIIAFEVDFISLRADFG